MRSLAHIAPIRETGGRFFNERRLEWYAAAIVVIYAITLVAIWPILHSDRPGHQCFDFNWIWLTGKLAFSHAAAQVYHPSTLPPDVAALSQFHCRGTPGDGQFRYPPTILFFTYPLGLMSYSTAMVAWIGGTLLLYLIAIYAILPSAAAVVAALTTFPVVVNIVIGHNGFLTAGLFGLALALMERRPWLSGIFLGLLTYKPQFGILFPLALLTSRNRRVIISATGASIAFATAAGMAFGFNLWSSFLSGFLGAAANLNRQHWVSSVVFPTVLDVLQHASISAQTAWGAQAFVAAAVAVAVCILWARPVPHPLKAAAISVGTLLATPYALNYDHCILSIAVAFLVKDGLARGFLNGERTIILSGWAACSLFPLIGIILLGAVTHAAGFGQLFLYLLVAPVPLIVCAVLFFTVLRRGITNLDDRLPIGRPTAPIAPVPHL